MAENASYQAFVNCYLREVDVGVWHPKDEWCKRHHMQGLMHGQQVVELSLSSQCASLVLDVAYRSLMGRHRLSGVWVRAADQGRWAPLEPFVALTYLVREMYGRQPHYSEALKAKEVELLYRLVESYQLMTRFIHARQQDVSLAGDHFIESEQSLLFGHWFHPTPKSRQGMLEWQQGSYSPELAGGFQLHFFAVKGEYVAQGSLLSRDTGRLLGESFATEGTFSEQLAADEVLFPMHPLQACWLKHQSWVCEAEAEGWLRDLGKQGPEFRATSSVRTLYSRYFPWMLKFSIPVKITNSLRINQLSELKAGVVAAKLLQNSGFLDRYPLFVMIMDPGYMTIKVPDALASGNEESGFEMVLRSNPFTGDRGVGVHAIAAIMQDPLPGRRSRLRTLIEGLALSESRSIAEVSRDWFRLYWQCGPQALLSLYEEQGIALEAHQQNSLLDVSCGYPRRYFYRDNQGFYLARSYKDALLALEPGVAQSSELFYDEALIRDRFCYYLVLNQLAAVIHRFGADGLLKEDELIAFVQACLLELQSRFQAAGQRMVSMLLTAEKLPYKGNLLTRLHDVDELVAELEQAVYTQLDNPLRIDKTQTAEPQPPEVLYESAIGH